MSIILKNPVACEQHFPEPIAIVTEQFSRVLGTQAFNGASGVKHFVFPEAENILA